MEGSLPPGYKKYGYADPFEDYVGPFGYKIEDGKIHFAFRAEPHHANTGNTLHGGILMTFADFALCLTAIHGLPDERCVTVSLNCEFTAPGQVGDFIESTAEVVRRARSLTFVRGTIAAGDRALLNYSGIVKRYIAVKRFERVHSFLCCCCGRSHKTNLLFAHRFSAMGSV